MSEDKEIELNENKVHRVAFKKDPVWLRANFSGKYEGINFGFIYKEFYDKELEEVIKQFNFTWPGMIPVDKNYAEKGIMALFSQLKHAEKSSIHWDVTGSEGVESQNIIDDQAQIELDNLETNGIPEIIENEEVDD